MLSKDLPPVPHRPISATLAGVFFAVLATGAVTLILGLEAFDHLEPLTGWSIAMGIGSVVGIALTWVLVASPLHTELGVSVVRSQTAVDAIDQMAALMRIEQQLDLLLGNAETQAEIVLAASDWLARVDKNRPMEIHLIHPRRETLELVASLPENQAVATPDADPDESKALREMRTLSYATTATHDVCGHLASRRNNPTSAIAVPLHVGDHKLGVLYATGPLGVAPSEVSVEQLERFAGRLSARLAAVPAAGVGIIGQRAVGE